MNHAKLYQRAGLAFLLGGIVMGAAALASGEAPDALVPGWAGKWLTRLAVFAVIGGMVLLWKAWRERGR